MCSKDRNTRVKEYEATFVKNEVFILRQTSSITSEENQQCNGALVLKLLRPDQNQTRKTHASVTT